MKWNKNNCLIDTNTDSKYSSDFDCPCWFDKWSLIHILTNTFFLTIIYIFILILMKKPSNKLFIILFVVINIIHIIDDLLNNYVGISLESLKTQKHYDNDSLQNFLGDIICGLIGTCIILFLTLKYKNPIIIFVYTLILTISLLPVFVIYLH
jgi:hypothetical protein